MLSSENTAKWLAVIRIYGGAFWLIHAIPKFMGNGFLNFLPAMTQKLAQDATGPYHTFVVTTVVPHADVIAQLMRAGELLVGISLLLGLFTRVGAIGGMFLAANYMLAKGAFGTFDGWASLDGAAFAISFINLVLPTAAVWSADALMPRRRRR
jgi:thiosulfate dehydrogenase [quinone] large subunit